MRQLLQDILFFCSAWIIVIPAVTGILLYKKLGKEYKVLCIQLFIACDVELASYIMSRNYIPNLPLLHVYTLTEFFLLYLFFETYFSGFYPVKILRSAAVAFLLFSIINSLFIQSVYEFNSYARAAESFMLVLLCLLAFYKLSAEQPAPRAIYWISTGILLYFAGAFLLFILSNYILSFSTELNFSIWAVHAFLSVLMYTFITAGLWISLKK